MNLSRIICDSGSTKAVWMTDRHDEVFTDGINALQTPEERIDKIISSDLLPALQCSPEKIERIDFYGAGVIGDTERSLVSSILKSHFPCAEIYVENDLLGACRALCGDNLGIACILGTGSNSCLYDGGSIVKNVPPLGYILGDEGSGAVLGKRLVGDILKGIAPSSIKEAFYRRFDIDYASIIRRVYREPGSNAFLASFVPFLSENLTDSFVHDLVIDEFSRFFRRNIMQYSDYQIIPVGFVGSIAFYFKDELMETASRLGITVGKIIQSPIRSLTDYHLGK